MIQSPLQEGINPYCGYKGLCCRFNQIKDENSGCRETVNGVNKDKGIEGKHYHHCVKP